MKCGHNADAVTGDGRRCCSKCYRTNPLALQVSEIQPILIGRKACCQDCNLVTESSIDLAFFEYRPGEQKDLFFCGCN